MNTNDLNTALYEKMAAEQDKYRDWLKSQPPEEILNHTYEYTIREDIVMAMEELELTDAQAKALLESPSPLADVYRYFEKLETGYMDVIRDSIESRANEVCREPEELNPMVVYLHSASYATKHGETDAYWMSDQANFSCKVAIEQAISTHYGDNRLDTSSAVQEVMEKFGPERMNFILANTIQHKDADGRISRDNKAWAKTIPMPEDSASSQQCADLVVDRVNPGLVDLFTRQARKIVQEKRKRLCPAKAQAGTACSQACRPKETGAGEITMAKRKRDMQLNFRVSSEELAVIEQKMSQFGTSNREAYLRKMALDGYVVKLELPELKELVSLMRRSSNNLNQLTRKVHETGRVYDTDLEDISQRQEQLWEGVREILTQLSKLS